MEVKKKKRCSPSSQQTSSLSYLIDVFNIKFDVKGEFDVPIGKDSLFSVTVPAQTTEGASVEGSLFVCSKTKEELQLLFSAWFPFQACRDA